jgi:signal peptidase II
MDDARPLADDAPPRRRGAVALLWALVALVVALDQVTKALAVRYLADRDPVPVIEGYLQLRLLFNPGAAFSMATRLTWLLTIVAVVVVVVILRMSRRLGSRAWGVALGLLLGGAVGNLIDRLARPPGFARGHVVDFIEWPGFPVFNVADSAITSAAVLIVILGMLGKPVEGKVPAGTSPAPAGSGDDGGGARG